MPSCVCGGNGRYVVSIIGLDMAKKRGRPRSDRNEKVVRIEAGLAVKVQRIADHQGVAFSEAHSTITEAVINRAYAKMLRELDAAEGGD